MKLNFPFNNISDNNLVTFLGSFRVGLPFLKPEFSHIYVMTSLEVISHLCGANIKSTSCSSVSGEGVIVCVYVKGMTS